MHGHYHHTGQWVIIWFYMSQHKYIAVEQVQHFSSLKGSSSRGPSPNETRLYEIPLASVLLTHTAAPDQSRLINYWHPSITLLFLFLFAPIRGRDKFGSLFDLVGRVHVGGRDRCRNATGDYASHPGSQMRCHVNMAAVVSHKYFCLSLAREDSQSQSVWTCVHVRDLSPLFSCLLFLSLCY